MPSAKRNYFLALFLGLFFLSSTAGDANSQDSESSILVEALDEQIEMDFLDTDRQVGIGVEQRVIGAVGVLSAGEFPGILQFLSQNRRICTAALVGPQALLTAAHCLGSKNYSVRVGGSRVRMNCYHHSSFNTGPKYSNDWALCKLDRKVRVSVYETLDVSNRPQPDKVVMLTGYGCTEPGGKSKGLLLYGYAKVIHRPPLIEREDTAFFTQASLQDPATGASLCTGDSGGPVFVTGTGGPTDRPLIVGVNSRTYHRLNLSWFSATASNTGLELFSEFVEKFDTPICGLKYKGSIFNVDCR